LVRGVVVSLRFCWRCLARSVGFVMRMWIL
jgi:hypothetical protein